MDYYSDPQLFKTYLSQHMNNIPWMRFKVNRFNVIFNNALGLLQIKYHIIQYLENTKSSLNFIVICIKLLRKSIAPSYVLCTWYYLHFHNQTIYDNSITKTFDCFRRGTIVPKACIQIRIMVFRY